MGKCTTHAHSADTNYDYFAIYFCIDEMNDNQSESINQ